MIGKRFIKVIQTISRDDIPPFVRSKDCGPKGVTRELFVFIKNLHRDNAIVVEHNYPSGCQITGRIYTEARRRGIKIRVVIRGKLAYITKETV